jgi:hypothetical protein
MRRALLAYATDMVAWDAAGILEPHECRCEILMAGAGMAKTIGAPYIEGIAAANAALASGAERYAAFAQGLRRRIWPLGNARAPGEEILLAAHDVNAQHGTILPTELLVDAARRIAHSAVRRIARGRR